MAAAGAAAAALHWRLSIRPSRVHQLCLDRLSASPAVDAALGAPLASPPGAVRALVLTPGGPHLAEGWRPAWRPARCRMVFPLQGPKGRGLVSAECRVWHGRHQLRALAVDVPSTSEESASSGRRVFLVGGAERFNRGGVLRELRDPFLRALRLEATGEQGDENDRDESAEEELEVERGHRADLAALGAGLPVYFSEWVVGWARGAGGLWGRQGLKA